MATPADEMDMMGVVVGVDDAAAAAVSAETETESEAETAEASTATLFDYAMASTYNTAGTNALVTSADVVVPDAVSEVAAAPTENAYAEAHTAEPMDLDDTGATPHAQEEMTTADTGETNGAAAAATAAAALFNQQAALETEMATTPHDKKTGRPSHPAWEHFVRGDKRNRFHHHAYCKYCSAHGAEPSPVRGVSGNMIRHLQKCIYCPEEIVAQLRILCAQKDAVNFNKRHQQHQPTNLLPQQSPAEMSGVGGMIQAHVIAAAAAAAAAAGDHGSGPSAAKKLKRTTDHGNGSANATGSARLGQDTTTSGPFVALQMPMDMSAAVRGHINSAAAASANKAKARGNFATSRNGISATLSQSSAPHQPSVVNQAALNRLVLKATLSSSLPLDWMAMEEAFRLTALPAGEQEKANYVAMPLRSALYEKDLVASLTDVTHETLMSRLKDDICSGNGGGGVTLAINFWFSKAERTNMLLFSIVDALGESTAWKLVDVGMAEVALEELSAQIKTAVAALSEEGIPFVAIVTDSLLAYAAAKAAITSGDDPHPPIAVLPSFEAFLVNALGVILTISESHTETMGNVIDLVAAFSNTGLRDTLRRECGDADAALVLPCKDKWFSFIDCIDSVRQFEDMIKIIGLRAMIHQSDAAAAAAATSNSAEEGGESSSGSTAKPSSAASGVTGAGGFPTHVLETIQNPHFWETVVSLSELMSPIKETYKLMLSHNQSTSSTTASSRSKSSSAIMTFSLSNVFYQLGRMYQQYTAIIADWEENPSASRLVGHVRYLQELVNKTWKLYDQPLMFLAYTLDYHMSPSLLARNLTALQWLSMGKYAKEYFRRWFCAVTASSMLSRPNPRGSTLNEEAATQFLEDVLAFKERKYPFDADSVCDFENPRAFYQLISDSNPLMHLFGSRMFSFTSSVPQLSRVIPGKNSVTRVATAACSQSLLLPLIQLKLRARTAVKAQSSSEFLAALLHNNNRNARRQSAGATNDGGHGSTESDKAVGTALLSGSDESATQGIWSDREWRLLAKQWKIEWEHEGDVGNALDTVAGFNSASVVSSRLQIDLLTLDQIFKEKLPSRLQQSRDEEAVVDV